MSYRFEEAFYDRAIASLQKLVRIKSVEEKNDGPHPSVSYTHLTLPTTPYV